MYTFRDRTTQIGDDLQVGEPVNSVININQQVRPGAPRTSVNTPVEDVEALQKLEPPLSNELCNAHRSLGYASTE